MIDFPALETLTVAVSLGTIADDRPDWLKAMPSASDNTAYYYPFFYQLARQYGPLKMLEIGTYKGTSAAHMAAGAKAGGHEASRVVTLDISKDAQRMANEVALTHGLDITAVVGASFDSVGVLRPLGPFDLLLIDAEHNFTAAYREYVMYRELVKPYGLIFFDDIALDMASHEMQVLWETIPDPKMRLDPLHYTGFGVAMKYDGVRLLPWHAVIKDAEKRMLELGWEGPPTVKR